MKKLVIFFSTGCYVGKIPFAPGTWGSLLALPLFLVFARLSSLSYSAFVLVFLFFAVWISTEAARMIGDNDPPEVVIDEVVGILVALAFHHPTPLVMVCGFVCFRLFDIWKPFPCRKLEQLPGGWGIVLDDVMAGIYANVVISLGQQWL